MTTTEPDMGGIDTAAAEEFAGRLIGIFNDACIALMTSIGHQTGLFDTLAQLPPSPSRQVADTAGLSERYVREWLNAMTTARIVVHDPDDGTYSLPREHAASLTEAAGPDNLARIMQFVAMLAEVEQPIVECFRQGGGLPYSAYPRFHKLMADDSGAVVDAALVDTILPLVEGLRVRLGDGIDAADIGCGSGHAINVLAQTYPASRFTGYDFSEEAIAAARHEAETLELTNARFEVLDVATLDAEARYDLVTAFDAIHDQAHPAAVLDGISRALRADGVFLMIDIKASSNVNDNTELPWGTFLYAVSTMHCMTVSLGLDGDGLGTAWGEQLAVSMLQDAGFENVDVREIETDPFNNYYLARK